MGTVYEGTRRRLFVDMDGVLAEFKAVDTLETLYEEGYFYGLKPQENVINAIWVLSHHPDIEVFILSAVLTDSKYALEEKKRWIDEYMPWMDEAHQIFTPCGEDKKLYIPDGIRQTDCLLDDYTHNLTLWEPPARGVKLLNGINHTHGTWQGRMVDMNMSDVQLAAVLQDMVLPARMDYRLVEIVDLDGQSFFCKDYSRDPAQILRDYMESRTWLEFSEGCEIITDIRAAELEQQRDNGTENGLICTIRMSKALDLFEMYFPDRDIRELTLREAMRNPDLLEDAVSTPQAVREEQGDLICK